MKLNMSIFQDWLTEFQPTAKIQSDALEIETVRLFSQDLELQKNTLYIGTLHDLFRNGNNKVICTHQNDILLLETDDIQAVLNSILNAVDYYARWETEMLQLLASNCILQHLLNASEDILKRPTFLLDVGQRMLASSQKYQPEDDYLWNQMIESGSSEPDFLVKINQDFPDRFLHKGLFKLPKEVFPSDEYHMNFFLENNWIGCAVILNRDTTMTQGELSLFQIYCSFIDRWYQNHMQEQTASQLQYQLLSAIRDANNDNSELLYLLKIHDWKDTDRLIFIQLFAPYKTYHFDEYLAHTLDFRFPNIYSFTTDKSICLLCNLTQKPWEQLKRELQPWVKGSRYYGSYSPAFTLNDSFYQNFQYTELTNQFCAKKAGEFYDGSEFLLKHLLHKMQDEMLVDVIHPALLSLQAYDKRHHADFCHTLYVYLKNERSPHATAVALNMHRNSLAYRIKRIQELLDVDLNDHLIRLHMLLSFEIMALSHLKES